MKARSEVIAMALPAAVLVLIDWGFWGLRNEQAGWGVNIDGLALLAAFIVALAASGPAPDEPAPRFLDSLLHRFAIASFGFLAAGACSALVAYLRLGSVLVGPELVSQKLGVDAVLLLGFVLALAPGLAWLLRELFVRIGHAPRALASLASLGLAIFLVALPAPRASERVEYVSSSFATVASLEAMTLDAKSELMMIGDSQFQYLAVSDRCVFRPTTFKANLRIAEQSVAVPASRIADGFAVCPALEIYEFGNAYFGRQSDSRGRALFKVEGDRVVKADLIADVHLDQHYPVRKTVPSIRAPRGLTADRETKGGISVERTAAGMQTCRVTVRQGNRILYDDGSSFLGVDTTLNICRALTVTRSESLGVVSLRMQDDDRSASWDDTNSRVWLSGVGSRELPLAAIASKVSAPKSWRVGSAAGLVVGLVSLLASFAWLIQLRRLGRFALAHHDGGGKLVLGDDSVVQVDSAAVLEPGDVFVHGVAPASREAAYRAPAMQRSATLVVRAAIEVDRERERLAARVMFASALAFAFPLATSALMVAARVFGLGG